MADVNLFIPQPVPILWIVPTKKQDFALGLVELHGVQMGPNLRLHIVPLIS